jgi:hypothetical protein
MPVWFGLIMLVAQFCPNLRPSYTTMNEALLAASALLVHNGAFLVSIDGFINFFAIVQC